MRYLFFFLLTAIVLTGCGDDDKSAERAENANELLSLLEDADSYVDESMQAILESKYGDARRSALIAKGTISDAKIKFEILRDGLSAEDVELVEKLIEYEDRWATLAYKTANIQELSDELFAGIDSEEAAYMIPKVELLERGMRENAEDWNELANFLERNLHILQRMGIGKGEVDSIRSLSESTFQLADTLVDYKSKLVSQLDNTYTPLDEREIEGKEVDNSRNSELITPEVAELFESFDRDGNGKLSIAEAEEFFYWAENSIAYRYDDENAKNTVAGFKVGDGRDGGDYRQTPEETIKERAGDCEDLATLEVAFYKYYGIEAYVVGVDTKIQGLVDHAAAIVKIGDNKERFKKVLGNLLYYELEDARDVYGNRISPGVYMIVDNTYSGAFGYISGGTDAFMIYCIIPFEKGYGEEWNKIVRSCVSMD